MDENFYENINNYVDDRNIQSYPYADIFIQCGNTSVNMNFCKTMYKFANVLIQNQIVSVKNYINMNNYKWKYSYIQTVYT
jgi:hypothetical protein